jgi:AcrR family transcriptional regulator
MIEEEKKIISYATNEFLENGFYKTSMDQLAKGMQISKKTIYKFFPSKYSLLEIVLSTFQKKVKSELESIVDSDKNLVEKLKLVGEFFAKFSLKVNKKILSDFFNHQPELWKKVDDFRTSVIEDIWEKLINQGKSEGLIIDKSNKLLITIILSALRGVINPTFLMENNISTNEAFNETFAIILNGILTEKGKKEFENQEWNRK